MQISEVLPHRAPFLFVDEIKEHEYLKYAKGIKSVQENEFWVPGHFPGNPVFPGVLLLETMAQVGGFIFAREGDKEYGATGKFAYLSKVDGLKFKQPVKVGDTIEVEVVLMDSFLQYSKVSAKAKANGKLVAQAEITYTFLDAL